MHAVVDNKLHKTGFPNLVDIIEARDGFLAHVESINRVEQVPVGKSVGRILAMQIMAPSPVPSFDRSAMDGYAIVAEDSSGASVQDPRILGLEGAIAIGEATTLELNSGDAIKVATGSAIPPGANVVIKIEDTELDDDGSHVKVYRQLEPGVNIIRAGEDYQEGQMILDAGHQLIPQDIGVLATIGFANVRVLELPTISVFATGNELVDLDDFTPGEDGTIDLHSIGEYKMIDSNRFAIQALVEHGGGHVVNASHLPDDKDTIRNAINDALSSSDMVITTGGTSVGERDYIPSVIETDHQVLYHGIAMKPGSATLLGTGHGKPILGLSGFPVAAEIGMLYFGIPAIKKLAGASKLDPRIRIPARMAEAVAVKGSGITRMLRVAVSLECLVNGELPLAVPVKMSGGGMQRSMVESDGFVEIPPEMEGYEQGDTVIVALHFR